MSDPCNKAMQLKPPFIIVGHRHEPTCGRDDCDCGENPAHWVSAELTPEAKKALKMFPKIVSALDAALSALAGLSEDCDLCEANQEMVDEALSRGHKLLRKLEGGAK